MRLLLLNLWYNLNIVTDHVPSRKRAGMLYAYSWLVAQNERAQSGARLAKALSRALEPTRES